MHATADDVRHVFGPTVADIDDQSDGTGILATGANQAEEIALYFGTSGIVFDIIDGDELHDALGRLTDRVMQPIAVRDRFGLHLDVMIPSVLAGLRHVVEVRIIDLPVQSHVEVQGAICRRLVSPEPEELRFKEKLICAFASL